MATWATPVTLLFPLVSAIAAAAWLHRRRLMTFRWPEGIGNTRFAQLCAAYLRRSGWELSFEDAPFADVKASRGGRTCVLVCHVFGQPIGPAVSEGLNRLIKDRHTVVVICYDVPSPGLVHQCLMSGLYVIRHVQLGELGEIISRPPEPPASLMLDGWQLPEQPATARPTSYVTEQAQGGEEVVTNPEGDVPSEESVLSGAAAREGLTLASQALERGDLAEAAGRWEAVRQMSGAPVEAWLLAAKHASADEAFALLQDASVHFPADRNVLHDLARAAERGSDWQVAERAWQALAALEASPWWAYVGLADAIMRQDRRADAEAALSAALQWLPDEPNLHSESARMAESAGDLPEAIRRWTQVTERFPDYWKGYKGLATALTAAGQGSQVSAYLREKAAGFPNDLDAQHDLARLAESEGDWHGAVKHWRAFIELGRTGGFEPWWAHESLIGSLVRSDQLAEADTVYRDALLLFPAENLLSIHYARDLVEAGYPSQGAAVAAWVVAQVPHLSTDDLVFLGRITMQNGDWTSAVACADRMLGELPAHQQATEYVRELQERLAAANPARREPTILDQ